MRTIHLFAAALAGSLAVAAPALAQDSMEGANLPTCSATVTDHCMQREHRMMAPKHHKMAKHAKARRHHRHARKHSAN